MKIFAIATLALALGASSAALAQPTDPSANPNPPGAAAVKAPHENRADQPVAGHTSFTRSQARGHIENSGYSHVRNLVKSKDGIWHATATQDGKSLRVTLDYQGNVNPE